MSFVLAANNAAGSLAGSIGPTATTINLGAGEGALFPAPGAGEIFVGTLRPADDSSPDNEIVHCTAVVGDTLTVVRAREGTTGQSWAAGDAFLNLFTAGTMDVLIQEQDLQNQTTNYAEDAGSANAYLANFVPAITTYVDGSPLRILIGNTNSSGVCTLDAGAGAVAIKTGAGNNPQIGEIVAGAICTFFYSAGVFQLQPPSGAAFVNARTIRYTASATYTPPAGLLRADVTCYGPGGGGGGAKGSGSGAGGGGSGAIARKILTIADIGASQAMTISAAGAGGTNVGGNGSPGAGNTSFGALVVAGPGAGGNGATGGPPSAGSSGLGGTPSAGDFLHYGVNGGASAGGSDTGLGGNGGGDGGGLGNYYSGAGGAARGVTGGGGGGASDNTNAGFAGGNGAPGSIEIVEYYG